VGDRFLHANVCQATAMLSVVLCRVCWKLTSQSQATPLQTCLPAAAAQQLLSCPPCF
jgi:hypothetical protein